MGRLTSWICLTVTVWTTAHAQLEQLGNSVVDENFFVVGELEPGETLDQFERRFRQENPSSAPKADPETPRVPAAASSSEPLGLSSGAAEVLGRIDDSFSCEGLPYGYYSDPSNDCRVYHICNPGQDGGQTNQYSFFCNAGTEFDQRLLTCVNESPDRSACSDVYRLYESSNSQFFRDIQFNAEVSSTSPVDPNPPSAVDNNVVEIGVDGGIPVNVIQPSIENPTELVLPANQGPPQAGINNSIDGGEGSVDGAGLIDVRFGLS